jgi:hypothetical protein
LIDALEITDVGEPIANMCPASKDVLLASFSTEAHLGEECIYHKFFNVMELLFREQGQQPRVYSTLASHMWQ